MTSSAAASSTSGESSPTSSSLSDVGTKSAPILCAFIGNPSAGKSSLLNALARRRLALTGMSRTTMNVQLVGSQNRFEFPPERFKQATLQSTDGVFFDVLDLPGVSDAEDTSKTFDDLTEAWIEKADVVVWVSDSATAFNTRHEKDEFDKILDRLRRSCEETGTSYHVLIVLSKFNAPPQNSSSEKSTPPTPALQTVDASPDEIDQCCEDTSYADALERVNRMYADPVPAIGHVKVCTFNAHGYVLNTAGMSSALVNFVRTISPHAYASHLEFNLRPVIDTYTLTRMRACLNSWRFHWKKYEANYQPIQRNELCGGRNLYRAGYHTCFFKYAGQSVTSTCARCKEVGAILINSLNCAKCAKCVAGVFDVVKIGLKRCFCSSHVLASERSTAWGLLLDHFVTSGVHTCGSAMPMKCENCTECKNDSQHFNSCRASIRKLLNETTASSRTFFRDELLAEILTPVITERPSVLNKTGRVFTRFVAATIPAGSLRRAILGNNGSTLTRLQELSRVGGAGEVIERMKHVCYVNNPESEACYGDSIGHVMSSVLNSVDGLVELVMADYPDPHDNNTIPFEDTHIETKVTELVACIFPSKYIEFLEKNKYKERSFFKLYREFCSLIWAHKRVLALKHSQSVSVHVFQRLTQIADHNDLEYLRIYYRGRFYLSEAVKSIFVDKKYVYFKQVLTTGHPWIFDKNFQKKVAENRRYLWGDAAEDSVDVPALLISFQTIPDFSKKYSILSDFYPESYNFDSRRYNCHPMVHPWLKNEEDDDETNSSVMQAGRPG
jgi:GTP-binding protein EngB required for normal cell division